ncbi:Asp23/Gls24 family envelope stress response protein [Streptomyces sp. NPDC015131]|uniref:Asp23/Gls24 family envelope stress response protein n=1 Tax=Streptomyces sp. NPDC015131 TaxID=3364941 RepID=UPI0037016516
MAATTGGGDAVAGVSAAERGATTIADRVVAKIAAHAAREALDEVPGNESTAGDTARRGGGAGPPHAAVVVHRNSARVRVSLELDYPCDIGARCRDVRRQVIRRVRTLAGMEVPEVAVQVERLHSPYTRERDKSGGRVR